MLRNLLKTLQLVRPNSYLVKKFCSHSAKLVVPSQNIVELSGHVGTSEKEILPKPQSVNANSYLDTTAGDIKPTLNIRLQETVSFDDIPGPASLRTISKLWGLIPLMGTEVTVKIVQYLLNRVKPINQILGFGDNTPLFKRLFDLYGPIVRLHGAFGNDVVLLSRPEDATAALKSNHKSLRCCLDSVEKYRSEYRTYKESGPFLIYGPDWEKLRKTLDQPLYPSLSHQYDKLDSISDEFVERIAIIRNKQEEMTDTFKIELYKWSLECLSSITFNQKLGFLDNYGLSPTSDPGRLLDGLIGATEAIRKCEYNFHLWKFFDTPSWKSLVKNCDMINSVLNKHVNKAINSLRDRREKNTGFENITLVESLLLKENIVEEDVMTILLDMFLIGANATAHTITFLLYHLAKNPRCQIKLHEEMVKKQNYLITDLFKQMPYIEACIKECLRLDPPIPVLNRMLQNDVIINHYRIPKGTHILFATHLNSTREEYFEDPQKFKPERWLSDDIGTFGNEYQKFASMPFGHGPKSRLVREMAKVKMAMLLAKILKKYRIEYNYGDARTSHEFLASPNKLLKFRFVDRVN